MRRSLTLAVLFALAACSSSPHARYFAYVPQEEAPLPSGMNTESYARLDDNPFLLAQQNPLSTFSIDVDTASYSNVRRFLSSGTRPPKDAVRIEELVNYFPYRYPAPTGDSPFAVHSETLACPWSPTHRLVKLGIKGRELEAKTRPAVNLVFLLDVSGSMADSRKLPLLKKALELLVTQLREDDRVAIVVYAGASGLVLPSTAGSDKSRILGALQELGAGGSTHGAAGIELAYRTAEEGFRKGGINRVILATDGDFNVGTASEGALTRLIEEKAKSGVALTVLGLGMGNYKDSMLEKLADKGNGNYAYLDTLQEAKKVLVEQASGTFVTIAKDVKLQLEFNPARVQAYRLIGYENRLLRSEDFNDDLKDAGDLGAGHTVTALYEVVPVGEQVELPLVDPLKYQRGGAVIAEGNELLTVKLRYKHPEGESSRVMSFAVMDGPASEPSPDARFAAAVAEFGLLLRDSPHKGTSSWSGVLELASSSVGEDPYRREFLELVKRAQELGATTGARRRRAP